ncbi:MAG: hypothetical protein EZS28_020015 [Streblomastix strix]|uniref:Uncharacterized protein n=1 Tax=Streblomastix strix TaxID=222440 RepID=A0A5J4VPQ4_9EUKA|nr:MAG: hypothetical protein EZS28_020015 [Streblomastix strix]
MTNTSIQDIGQLQADIQVIDQELVIQTHFRGYFATNEEILALQSSAVDDYAYSAEELLVRVYQNSWVETDQIVPDQVTPARNTTSMEDSGTSIAGTGIEYTCRDHQHPLQVSIVLPVKDTATGEEGTATTYARSDHAHHINLSN